jgi:hypothetical protein
MRHSDLRLTLNTYTAAELLPLRETIDALPSFYPETCSQICSQNLGGTGAEAVGCCRNAGDRRWPGNPDKYKR